jgi:hypothetical protein
MAAINDGAASAMHSGVDIRLGPTEICGVHPTPRGVRRMAVKKFYKTILTVTILTEHEPAGDDLGAVSYQIIEGDASGLVERDFIEVTAAEMAALLIAQNSDPSFFGLNADGSSEDDEDA